MTNTSSFTFATKHFASLLVSAIICLGFFGITTKAVFLYPAPSLNLITLFALPFLCAVAYTLRALGLTLKHSITMAKNGDTSEKAIDLINLNHINIIAPSMTLLLFTQWFTSTSDRIFTHFGLAINLWAYAVDTFMLIALLIVTVHYAERAAKFTLAHTQKQRLFSKIGMAAGSIAIMLNAALLNPATAAGIIPLTLDQLPVTLKKIDNKQPLQFKDVALLARADITNKLLSNYLPIAKRYYQLTLNETSQNAASYIDDFHPYRYTYSAEAERLIIQKASDANDYKQDLIAKNPAYNLSNYGTLISPSLAK